MEVLRHSATHHSRINRYSPLALLAGAEAADGGSFAIVVGCCCGARAMALSIFVLLLFAPGFWFVLLSTSDF